MDDIRYVKVHRAKQEEIKIENLDLSNRASQPYEIYPIEWKQGNSEWEREKNG